MALLSDHDDTIQRGHHALELDPRLPAPARRVDGIGCLDHQPFVGASARGIEQRVDIRPLAGVGFALWGIAAIAYGTLQRAAVDKEVEEERPREPARWPLLALTLFGIGLGLLTAVLILFG